MPFFALRETLVPPTAVTNGELAGSLTASSGSAVASVEVWTWQALEPFIARRHQGGDPRTGGDGKDVAQRAPGGQVEVELRLAAAERDRDRVWVVSLRAQGCGGGLHDPRLRGAALVGVDAVEPGGGGREDLEVERGLGARVEAGV